MTTIASIAPPFYPWVTATFCSFKNSTDPTESHARGNDLVDSALVPVYEMANTFLDDIIQPRDLNYMKERGVNFTDPDSILDSFEEDWGTWAEYLIGKEYTEHAEQKGF